MLAYAINISQRLD